MTKSREAFRTISEVADWLDVQTHVLRFWESKFSQVKPVKRAGGRRYYRPQDMELLGGIKKLLHEDGMPIKDAQKMLKEMGVKHVSSLSQPVDEPAQPKKPQKDIEASETPETTPSPVSADETAENPELDAPVVSGDSPAAGEPATSAYQEDTPDDLVTPTEDDTSEPLAETQPQDNDAPKEDIAVTANPTPDLPREETKLPEEVALEAEDASGNASSIDPIQDQTSQTAAPLQDAPESIDDLFSVLEQAKSSAAAPKASPLPDKQEQSLPVPASIAAKEHIGASEAADPAPPAEQEDFIAEPPSSDAAELTQELQSSDQGQIDEPMIEAVSQAKRPSEATPPVVGQSASPSEPLHEAPMPVPSNEAAPAIEPNREASQQAPREEDAAEHASGERLGEPQTPSSAPEPATASKTFDAEDSKDAFLRVFTKSASVAPKDQSRAAALLARLEALHGRAS
jgi:DNA-binding transcriptional MerR regulator